MAVLRFQDRVPGVYVNESRDFQVMCRVLDCLINGVKFDIDSITDIIDTNLCDVKLLELLQTKLGFFTSAKISDDDLRYILTAFPYLVQQKGSLSSLEGAIYLFLKINKLQTDVYLNVSNAVYQWKKSSATCSKFRIASASSYSTGDYVCVERTSGTYNCYVCVHSCSHAANDSWSSISSNFILFATDSIVSSFSGGEPVLTPITEHKEATGNTYCSVVNSSSSSSVAQLWQCEISYSDSYIIDIGIEKSVSDVTILNELFKYILPTGYKINYFFYISSGANAELQLKTTGKLIHLTDDFTSYIRGYESSTPVWESDIRKYVIGAVDTAEVILPENNPSNTTSIDDLV